jgi:hypothetical protein
MDRRSASDSTGSISVSDFPKGAPLPNTLQSLALVVGADFQFGDAWLFRLELQPGFYGDGTDLRAEISMSR